MASIVKWQSFKMQEYRYKLLLGISGFLELFGIGQAYSSAPIFATTDEAFLERMQPVIHTAGRPIASRLKAVPSGDGRAALADGAGTEADGRSAQAPAGNAPAWIPDRPRIDDGNAKWSDDKMAELNGLAPRRNGSTATAGSRHNGKAGKKGGPAQANGNGKNGNGHDEAGAAGWVAPEGYAKPSLIFRHRLIVPINGIHQGTLTAVAYACSISWDVTAVHVAVDPEVAERLRQDWEVWGDGVRLEILESPHGMTLEPLLQYVQHLVAARQPRESITVVVPQMTQPRWWRSLWKSQLATLMRISLPVETGVVITDVPYQLA